MCLSYLRIVIICLIFLVMVWPKEITLVASTVFVIKSTTDHPRDKIRYLKINQPHRISILSLSNQFKKNTIVPLEQKPGNKSSK